jgi:hypothetical protein
MKLVINRCFGGFGLSDLAYERLGQLGIPIKKQGSQEADEEVIIDRELTPPGEDASNDIYWKYKGPHSERYWDSFTGESRTHPLVIQVVQELGKAANGRCADLEVVEIPDGIEYTIEDYDGNEHVAEKHRTW